MTKDGGRRKCRFEGLEGVLLGFSPFEFLIFLGEEGKGLDNAREVFDKPSVIIPESHEPSYVTEFLGGGPVHDGINLLGIHL